MPRPLLFLGAHLAKYVRKCIHYIEFRYILTDGSIGVIELDVSVDSYFTREQYIVWCV